MPSFRSAARAGIVAVLVLGLVPAAAHASSSSAKTAALQGALKHGSSGGGGGSSGGGGPISFYRPVNAPITSPFGMRWGRMHTGVDFGAPYGTRIGAAGRGTVVFAGWNSGGYGYLVIIQHR